MEGGAEPSSLSAVRSRFATGSGGFITGNPGVTITGGAARALFTGSQLGPAESSLLLTGGLSVEGGAEVTLDVSIVTGSAGAGVSYGTAIALVALAQVVVVTVVITSFPETAHLELEALNPEDAVPVVTPPV